MAARSSSAIGRSSERSAANGLPAASEAMLAAMDLREDGSRPLGTVISPARPRRSSRTWLRRRKSCARPMRPETSTPRVVTVCMKTSSQAWRRLTSTSSRASAFEISHVFATPLRYSVKGTSASGSSSSPSAGASTSMVVSSVAIQFALMDTAPFDTTR